MIAGCGTGHDGVAVCLSVNSFVHLTQGNRVLNDVEIDEAVDRAMTLFRFLSDKDLFEQYVPFPSFLSHRMFPSFLEYSLGKPFYPGNKLGMSSCQGCTYYL